MGAQAMRRSAITAAVAVGVLAAPAAASAAGTLSGTVYDEATDEGIAGVRVVAGPSGRPTTLEARTDADGAYTFGEIDAGEYDVGFLPDESGKYAPEWYGDVPVQILAEPVTVADGEATRASGFLAVGATVSGRVNDRAGGPAAKTCVAAVTFDRTASIVIALGGATTDASGNYSIGRLAPGYYRLWFGPSEGTYGKCAGAARDSGYAERWLDGAPDFFNSMPLKLASDKPRTGVDVQLDRTAAATTPGTGGPTAAPGKGCTVPKVTGMKPAAARKALKRARCKAGKTTQRTHAKVKRGLVIGTTPKAGTSLPAGATVALVVSMGPARGR